MALVEVLNLVIRPRSTRRVEQRQKVVVARVRHFCGALPKTRGAPLHTFKTMCLHPS